MENPGKKMSEFIEESKIAYADRNPNSNLKTSDWINIYENAIFLFLEWLDEQIKQTNNPPA
jgi:hypothetical protein